MKNYKDQLTYRYTSELNFKTLNASAGEMEGTMSLRSDGTIQMSENFEDDNFDRIYILTEVTQDEFNQIKEQGLCYETACPEVIYEGETIFEICEGDEIEIEFMATGDDIGYFAEGLPEGVSMVTNTSSGSTVLTGIPLLENDTYNIIFGAYDNLYGCSKYKEITIVKRSELPSLTFISGIQNPYVCIGVNIDPIGVRVDSGSESVTIEEISPVITGLPEGVTYSLTNNILTIIGSPAEEGTYGYEIITSTSSDICGSAILSGVIEVEDCSIQVASPTIYLANNGITCKCQKRDIGETANINDKEYTVVDEATLKTNGGQ